MTGSMLALGGGLFVLAGRAVKSEPGKGKAEGKLTVLTVENAGSRAEVACWGSLKEKADGILPGEAVFLKVREKGGRLTAVGLKRQGRFAGEGCCVLAGKTHGIAEAHPGTALVTMPGPVPMDGSWEYGENSVLCCKEASESVFSEAVPGDFVMFLGNEEHPGEFMARQCVCVV